MAQSILESITVQEPSYIDLIVSEPSIKKIFCPSSNHTEGSVKDIINTGFAIDDSLALKPCEEKPLAQPLYKENFLSEFLNEEEQRLARHNLGLFDDKDVVAMSLLTTGDKVEDVNMLSNILTQVLKKGNQPVAILTLDKAVYVLLGNKYTTLDIILNQYNTQLLRTNTRIDSILSKSYDSTDIKTLGDLQYFFKGVKNNTTLLEMVEDYLQFENKGEIEQIKWQ